MVTASPTSSPPVAPPRTSKFIGTKRSKMKKQVISRREFARRAAAAAALVAFPNVISTSVFGANSRINLAMIGCGNQGTNDLRNFLTDDRLQIVAVCDVNKESAGYWDGAVAGREPA